MATGPPLEENGADIHISGQITSEDTTPLAELILYVNGSNLQPLSVRPTANGSFNLSLATVRTSDLLELVSTNSAQMSMLIVSSTKTARVQFLLSQADPLPPIVFPNSYNFTLAPEPLSTEEASKEASLDTSFPSFSAEEPAAQNPQILLPQKEAQFSDTKPVFQGTALPGESVQVVIHSTQTIQGSVRANSQGNWSYRPTTPLTPGNHTITITTKDKNGILQTIMKQFTVYAEGSQFTEPSVSPVEPSPTATPIPTHTPTPTIFVSPTIKTSPTPTTFVPTSTPFIFPSPTLPIFPTATPATSSVPTPVTGSSSFIIISIATIIVTSVGILLFAL